MGGRLPEREKPLNSRWKVSFGNHSQGCLCVSEETHSAWRQRYSREPESSRREPSLPFPAQSLGARGESIISMNYANCHFLTVCQKSTGGLDWVKIGEASAFVQQKTKETSFAIQGRPTRRCFGAMLENKQVSSMVRAVLGFWFFWFND